MAKRPIGKLASSPIIKRHSANPILMASDVPFESKLAYNPGVVKWKGKYVMVFRSDHGWDPQKKKAPHFRLGVAESDDGVAWRVRETPLREADGEEDLAYHDPRLMLVEDRLILAHSCLTKHGEVGVICETDLETATELSRTAPDNRNLVVFPEKIGGRYFRLERPFPIMSRDNEPKFDIWMSESPDLVFWGESRPLLTLEEVPFANERLGAGSAPLRTDEGWLIVFHACDRDETRGKNGWEDNWQRRYTAGVMLLDLDDPRSKLAWSRVPLMVPEAPYETEGGFRNDVVFPTALVPEEDGTVKLYYGACDSWICLAETPVNELVAFAKSGG